MRHARTQWPLRSASDAHLSTDGGGTRARTRPLCQASGMDDKTILSRISELVDEEHAPARAQVGAHGRDAHGVDRQALEIVERDATERVLA